MFVSVVWRIKSVIISVPQGLFSCYVLGSATIYYSSKKHCYYTYLITQAPGTLLALRTIQAQVQMFWRPSSSYFVTFLHSERTKLASWLWPLPKQIHLTNNPLSKSVMLSIVVISQITSWGKKRSNANLLGHPPDRARKEELWLNCHYSLFKSSAIQEPNS